MYGHETALVRKIVGGQPEKVVVFRVVRQLPVGAVLAALQAGGDHPQVALDVAGGQVELCQPGARQRQQLARQQFGGRCALSMRTARS